jgi:hypothetical protein
MKVGKMNELSTDAFNVRSIPRIFGQFGHRMLVGISCWRGIYRLTNAAPSLLVSTIPKMDYPTLPSLISRPPRRQRRVSQDAEDQSKLGTPFLVSLVIGCWLGYRAGEGFID